MAQCQRCKQEIKWEKNDNDNWVPLNLDGVNHFETCPYSKEFRNKKVKGNLDYDEIDKDPKQKGLEEY